MDDSAQAFAFYNSLAKRNIFRLVQQIQSSSSFEVNTSSCESRKSSISWYFRRLGSFSSLMDISSLKLVDDDDDNDDDYLEQYLLKCCAQLTNARNVGK